MVAFLALGVRAIDAARRSASGARGRIPLTKARLDAPAGKSFDTHGPLGPWIVTPDEVGDPHALELRTWVNGELRQHSNTRELLFDCFDQVATLSAAFTPEPGDIVWTGTPAGVGGAAGKFLVTGDVIRVEIERIGAIENRVIEEPANAAFIA